MDGVQLLQGYRATTRSRFTFYHKFSEIPGTRLINLGRIKGLVIVEAELTMFIEKIVFRHIFTKVVGTANVFENFIKNFLRERYCSCVFH